MVWAGQDREGGLPAAAGAAPRTPASSLHLPADARADTRRHHAALARPAAQACNLPPSSPGKRRSSQKPSPRPARMKKSSWARGCTCGVVRCPGSNTSMPEMKGT